MFARGNARSAKLTHKVPYLISPEVKYILCPICFSEILIERRTEENVKPNQEPIAKETTTKSEPIQSPDNSKTNDQKTKPSDDEIADQMSGLLLQGWVMMAFTCEG